MKTIFIMMDSLNRNYLSPYGCDWVRTPNIDRLAQRGVVFDNYYSGSLPCIPARREMMTGRYNFLETPWGPIEPWDVCLPNVLRDSCGVYSHMITDHWHYFRSGGEAYHTLFSSWEFQRGQVGDPWRPVVQAVPAPEGTREKKCLISENYWKNRQFMDSENDLDYTTPQCFQQAIEFLEVNKESDDWHLHVEVFDPHEPFDCPQAYRDLYNDTWDEYNYSWPEYCSLDPELDTPEAVAHILKSYAGTLSMADHWLGRFLDKLEELNLTEEVTIILTTDHGYLLGEHGYWAKNYTMDYAELTHIPLIVCPAGPGEGGRRIDALTSTIDLMPTILDLHGAEVPDSVIGRSLKPLLEGLTDSHHDAVLYGYFGKDINMTDGRYTYCRQPLPESVVHHHTAMPRSVDDFIVPEKMAGAEMGVFLKSSRGIPHYRMTVPSRRHADCPDYNLIYDLAEDPGQTDPLRDEALEERLAAMMHRKLVEAGAPECQYDRMGLPRP